VLTDKSQSVTLASILVTSIMGLMGWILVEVAIAQRETMERVAVLEVLVDECNEHRQAN
jgi:hypothetical protein